MIDDKNVQLQRKETYIKKLREEAMISKESDLLEIQKLSE
jgi:hypothetical protein